MSAGGDGERYLGQMERHGLGIAEGQHQPRALAVLREDRAEDIGRFRPLVFGCRGPRPSSGPAPRDLVLLTVADIGAGEGYYTVRLAEKVGKKGRVLVQDIDQGAIDRLAERVNRKSLDNVSIKLGAPDDPRLPENSFDRIFLVHMYHEVREPYAFLSRLRPALLDKNGPNGAGEVIVVDVNRDVAQHGIPPTQLFCEFEAVGYELVGFMERPELGGYFARFRAKGPAIAPGEIVPCAYQGNGG